MRRRVYKEIIMKKRLRVIVTAVLAVVMSLALFACGEPDKHKNKPDKATVVQKAALSLDEYFGATTKSGRLGYKFDTKNTEPFGEFIDFETSDGRVFYELGENDAKVKSMFDVATGLKYVETKDGWMYDKFLYPQGTIEYAVAVMNASADDGAQDADADSSSAPELDLDNIVYNSSKNTLSASFDFSERVNRALYPIQEVYESEGSVIDLMDEYLSEYYPEITAAVPMLKLTVKPPLTVNKISTLLKATLALAKDRTLVEFVTNSSDGVTAADYEAFLVKCGFAGEALADAKARTVGEAIEGALAYINAKIDVQAIAGGDFSGVTELVKTFVSGNEQQKAAALAEIVQYVFVRDVDVTNFDKDVATLFDTVYDLLDAVKVKPLIDKLDTVALPGMSTQIAAIVGMGAPVVKEAIVSRTTFTALGGEVTFKLYPNYSVSEVNAKFIASHDYDGEASLPVLSDNDYTAEFTFIPSGTSNDPLPEISLARFDGKTEVSFPAMSAAVMNLGDESDAVVYLETRMFDSVEVVGITAAIVDENDERELVDGAVVRFDAQTSSLVFDCNGVQTVIAAKTMQGVRVKCVAANIVLSYGEDDGQTVDSDVIVFLAEDATSQSAETLVADIISSLRSSGGGLPSMPQD